MLLLLASVLLVDSTLTYAFPPFRFFSTLGERDNKRRRVPVEDDDEDDDEETDLLGMLRAKRRAVSTSDVRSFKRRSDPPGDPPGRCG